MHLRIFLTLLLFLTGNVFSHTRSISQSSLAEVHAGDDFNSIIAKIFAKVIDEKLIHKSTDLLGDQARRFANAIKHVARRGTGFFGTLA
jgi:hypothetical protein